uniref:Uncharacterized protein n=1 Tax=Timema monikensis TaxID=170555 RepID=A0A7R9DZD8_9NEOP|nr:unnamed protein product [Timema monikensis]
MGLQMTGGSEILPGHISCIVSLFIAHAQCAAPCEAQGIKYRILQCVWFGTKKPAGNACRDQPRPSVMKVCKGPPCAQRSSSGAVVESGLTATRLHSRVKDHQAKWYVESGLTATRLHSRVKDHQAKW